MPGAALAGAFKDRRVFLTGHTGFKGSWLALWLAERGARVSGFALPPLAPVSLFDAAGIGARLETSVEGDVRDGAALASALRRAEPELVIHLAAQSLVRPSYEQPADTWAINLMGTVQLLEAVRSCPGVKAVVVVTTDKCYELDGSTHAHAEADPLGGHDPYSASKAAAELLVQSHRRSFFHAGGPLLASARAGNVIGGGDFNPDRLIPDAVRAWRSGRSMNVRFPDATRPWQHVLESLHGYLLLARGLLAGRSELASAFNFGPDAADHVPVRDVLSQLQSHWPGFAWHHDATPVSHEAMRLHLDSTKARTQLGWQPVWTLAEGLAVTAAWYEASAASGADWHALTLAQIESFEAAL